MNKSYKTIRVSEDTYKQLIMYRAELEKVNVSRISFDEAIDLLFGEVHGLEYEMASERLAGKKTAQSA